MSQQHKLSRREALKTLTALTGAAALTSLPGQWAKPIVEVGALPAHAQTSSTAAIQVVNNSGQLIRPNLLGPDINDAQDIPDGQSYLWNNLTPVENYTTGAAFSVEPAKITEYELVFKGIFKLDLDGGTLPICLDRVGVINLPAGVRAVVTVTACDD